MQKMQLGMVGLGRMGANIVRRLMRDGHRCVVYDLNQEAVKALVAEGAVGARSLEELMLLLDRPRNVWVMVEAGDVTERVIADLAELLDPGDTIIDGGNTYYHDDIRRAAALAEKGLRYVDCGTSGGVLGLLRGYCLMIGGDTEAVRALDPIFRTLAPGIDAAERTEGRIGEPSPSELGYLHCGPAGAGHFIKMVHNFIEYGMMAAIAEGLNLIKRASVGSDPVLAKFIEHPEFYRFDFDIAEIAEVWRRGSIVGSFLLDVTAQALHGSSGLDEYSGAVSDSGEGRWAALAAVDVGAPTPVLNAALTSRFQSQALDDFAEAVLNAMRKGFGGHLTKKK